MFRVSRTGRSVRFRLKALALAIPFCSALPAFATVQPDAVSTAVAVQGSTSLSWNHALGNGGNRMIVCGVTFGYNDLALAAPLPSVPAMTFNGVAMTLAIEAPSHAQSSTSKIFSYVFYISDTALGTPAPGSYAVTVSNFAAVTGGVSAGCSSFFGVNPSAPYTSSSAYSGSALNAALTLSGLAAGDLVIDAFAGGYGSAATATVATGETQLYNVQQAAGAKTTAAANGGEISAAGYQIASGTSASMGWTNNASRSGYAAVAFAAAPTTNYTLTTAVSPVGAGTVSLSPTGGTYASGSNVQMTANPAIGYVFSSFSGDLSGTTNPGTININGNKNVTANFTATLCTLSTNVVGSGSITLSPTAAGNAYVCGTQVQVTAVPNSGNSFGNFSGALTGTTNPQTLTVNTSATVTATFTAGTSCTLSTSTTGSGTVSVSPSGTVFSCGTLLTVTATPANYYSLTGFSGAITGTTNPQTFVLNSNSTVAAAFSQTSFPINTTVVGPGTVTANPADNGSGYAPGTQVTLTATPSAGANFSGFSGDITGITNPQTLTVNATRNVTASFVASVITKDAVSHASSTGTAGNTLSWQHVLGSGGSRAVVVAVASTDSGTSPDPSAVVSSVLFNGVYATPVPASVVFGGTSGNVQAQLFYLLESELPPAGTYTITVTLTGSVSGLQAGAISFVNVSQGPAEAVITHKDTSGANLISTAITTLTPNAVVVDVVEDNSVAVLTANAGQTAAWSASSTLGTGGSSYKFVPTAGSATLGWAGSASRLVHSLASFAPATSIVPATYVLNTSVAGGVGGTITTNPGLTQYPVATGVLLTANAAVGYTFSGVDR